MTDADWVSLEEGLASILARCRPLGSERVPLEACRGRALASDIRSEVEHPAWDNSAMDGFAVRAVDVEGAAPETPVTLPVAGDVPAGSFPERPLEPGTAVRVMTGAPVPEGATGVIRIEHSDGGRDGRVAFHRFSDARRNIRRAGEDLGRGERVLRRGDEVTPAVAGVLAMTGHAEVPVGRRPRVALLATGEELADFDEFDRVRAGRRIMNSNSYALAAQLRSAGAEPISLGIARDDPGQLREKLEAASACDAAITTGGVSVGDHDHVRASVRALGMERVFWRAKVRPGTPILFGELDGGRPFWGLPGNPVSAMVTFEVFLRPAIRKMAGHAALVRRRIRARAAEEITCRPGYSYLFRVRLGEGPDGPPRARLTGPQGSNILTSMAAADGLLLVPEGTARLAPGDPAEVILLREWRRAGASDPSG